MAGERDPDTDLMLRVKQGDEAAFEVLVDKYKQPVLNLVYRILRDATEAEDLAQNVFVQVFKSADRYRVEAKFSTWLYRVVSNRCIDLRRKPRTENVDVVPEVADARPDASSVIERNELRGMLEGAMRRLPEHQRIAVILSYHENMSNGEIAEVMDTTVAAVESLLKRGRQQLRDLLRRHERDIRHAFTDL